MQRIKPLLQMINSFFKIIIVFAIIARPLFMPKTKRYFVLLSINLITIDLSSLLNFDSTTTSQVDNEPSAPKEAGHDSVEKDPKEDESQSNWSRNVMLFLLGAGCLLVVGGVLYYYFGPVAETAAGASAAAGAATATAPVSPSMPEVPVIPISAAFIPDNLLILEVFGNRNPVVFKYIEAHCEACGISFIQFTKVLYILPNIRKFLLRAIDTTDGEALDQGIFFVCSVAKEAYK